MILHRLDQRDDIHPLLFHQALRLGHRYGWRPEGTCPPPNWGDHCWEAWDETEYGCCLGEIVLADDACRWAAALETALDDIPDENVFPIRVTWIRQPDRIHNTLECRVERLRAVPLEEFFSGPLKKWLRAFIVYLRKGSFMVEC